MLKQLVTLIFIIGFLTFPAEALRSIHDPIPRNAKVLLISAFGKNVSWKVFYADGEEQFFATNQSALVPRAVYEQIAARYAPPKAKEGEIVISFPPEYTGYMPPDLRAYIPQQPQKNNTKAITPPQVQVSQSYDDDDRGTEGWERNPAYDLAQEERDGTVVITPYGTKYHRPNCGTVSGEKHKERKLISVKQALSLRYIACKVCHSGNP